MSAHPGTDRELLDREVALLWGRDDCDRVEAGPLRTVVAPVGGPQQPPAAVLAMVESGGLELRGCRSFVLEAPPPADPSGSVPLVTSTGPQRDQLRLLRPEPWWTRKEWSALLRGGWGPWAVTVEPAGPDDPDRLTVTALCHTPRLKDRCAEAGVWTHPDHRRRGLAVAVTAAWAGLAGRVADTLFYSARPDNDASLATAARLGARPIGTIWQLWRAGQGTSETSIA